MTRVYAKPDNKFRVMRGSTARQYALNPPKEYVELSCVAVL